MEEQQGLRCGEANSNQGLGGTSGQRPNTSSQRQPSEDRPRPEGAEGRKGPKRRKGAGGRG